MTNDIVMFFVASIEPGTAGAGLDVIMSAIF
jgi:hypothetical protein